MTKPKPGEAHAGARVLLGAVTGVHGIKGDVKVKTFTQSVENLGAYGALFTQDGRRLELASLRPIKNADAIAHFTGLNDRNAADSLKGQGLYVPRAALPAPKPGEFYLADLIGLAAQEENGAVLGAVKAVHNFGAGDILEIALSDGGSEFVPFNDDAVPHVDTAKGFVTIASLEDEP